MIPGHSSKRAEVKHSSSGRCLLSIVPEWNPSPHHRDIMIPCPKHTAPKNARARGTQEEGPTGISVRK